MPEKMFCPVHSEIQSTLKEIEAKQDTRPCDTHAAQIDSLYSNVDDIKTDNKDQWKVINHLKFLVYVGTGIMALIGSAFGNLIMSYFRGGIGP